MNSVGVRELRDHLSKHLAEVQEGQTVTITDRGKPIARIVPVGPSTLDRLIAEGRVRPARRPKRPARSLPKPVKAKGTVSDLVSEQRR
ncbi:MAG TPA: type II toxin-antitoxin system prevent-host-death family antitoxin [Nocardioidaceae bacterium]|nr:type II toxin-antitoxin system prevent-host-death family antitoxin [Nocardioidaceae bacterium]